MTHIVYAKYLESEVLSADPVKLIDMLYRGALDAVAAARLHLRERQIQERSRKIVKAFEILHELSRSLDQEKGGDISRRLADLYAYMQMRLMNANTEQSEKPLIEVENLLTVLYEAWRTVPQGSAQPTDSEYSPLGCAG